MNNVAKASPFSPLAAMGNAIVISIPILFLWSSRANWGPAANKVQGAVLALVCLTCHFLYRLKVAQEVVLLVSFTVWGGATGTFMIVNADYFSLYFFARGFDHGAGVLRIVFWLRCSEV